jgi:hypothetical protein
MAAPKCRRPPGTAVSSDMVNRQLPPQHKTARVISTAIGSLPQKGTCAATCFQTERDEFSETLGKQIFLEPCFELSENLRLILLDYAEKRADATNTAFNATC